MLYWNLIVSGLIFVLTVSRVFGCEHQIFVEKGSSVSIFSPGYNQGGYQVDLHCRWNISTTTNEKLNLTFLDFNIEYHMLCIWDYVLIYNGTCGSAGDIKRYCGTTIRNHLSQSAHVCVEFHSDEYVTTPGFQLLITSEGQKDQSPSTVTLGQSSSKTQPAFTSSTSSLKPSSTLSSTTSLTSLLSSTSSSTTSSGSSTSSSTTSSGSSPSSSTSSPPLMSSPLPNTVPPLPPSPPALSVQTLLMGQSSNGLSNPTVVEMCQDISVYQAEHQALVISPGYAQNQNYGYNRDCHLQILNPSKKVVKFSFVAFNVEKHSSCHWDRLEIKEDQDKILATFCGYLADTSNGLSSSATDINIVFISDNVVSWSGFQIKLSLHDPVTEPASTPPPTTQTTTTVVPMTTSESISTPVPPIILDSGYQQVYLKDTVKVFSPNFGPGQKYPVGITSKLKIQVSDDQIIHVNVLDLKVEFHPSCSWDSLSVYDGPSKSSALLKTFCGIKAGIEVSSSGPELFLEFVSDYIVPDKGFQLDISALKDSSTKTTTSIPSNKAPYLTSLSTTTLHLATPSKTTTTMQSTTTTTSTKTSTTSTTTTTSSTTIMTSTKVTTTPSTTTITTPPFTTTKTTPSTTKKTTTTTTTKTSITTPIPSNATPSTTKHMTSSPPTSQASDTLIELCAGTTAVSLPYQGMYLTSPNYQSGSYPTNVQCHLTVNASKPWAISVELMDLDIEENSICSWDSLSIYDGPNRNYQRLAKLCGKNIPSKPLKSSSNFIHFYFESDVVIPRKGFKARLYFVQDSTMASSTTSSVKTTTFPKSIIASTTDIFNTTPKTIEFTSQGTTAEAINPTDSATKATPKSTLSTSDVVPLTMTSTMKTSTIMTTTKQPTTSSKPTTPPEVLPVTSITTPSTPMSTSSRTTTITNTVTSASIPKPTTAEPLTVPTTSTTSTTKSISTETTIVPNTTPLTTKPKTTETPLKETTPAMSTTMTSPQTSLTTTVDAMMILPLECRGVPQVHIASSGTIQSALIDLPHTLNITCEWVVIAAVNHVIELTMVQFDLGSDCSTNHITVYDSSSSTGPVLATFCGDNIPAIVTSTTKSVLIRLININSHQKDGFKASYSSKATVMPPPTCLAGEFGCPSGECIPEEWLCDGEVDCKGAGDEQQCQMCLDEEFRCGNGECISGLLRCDGHDDCVEGLDEQNCVSIGSPDNSVMVMYHSQWYPVCRDDWNTQTSDVICQQLAFSDSTSMTPVSSDNLVYMTLKDNMISTSSPIHTMFEPTINCNTGQKVQLQCQHNGCGLRSPNTIKPYIIGGTKSYPGQWPWMVAIKISQKFICGGTLIGQHWVATASHCIESVSARPYLLNVMIGTIAMNPADPTYYKVTEIIMHPDNAFIYEADLALLRLQKPVTFNDHVNSLCLAKESHMLTGNSICYVSGWGVRTLSEYYSTVMPEHLHHAKMKLVSHSKCKESYQGKLKDTMICAGYDLGRMDSCKGDSGGPLMCQVSEARWVLAGITSWGETPCGQSMKPGVYTRVDKYRDWIIGIKDDQGVIVSGTHHNCTYESPGLCGHNDVSLSEFMWTRRSHSPTFDHTWGNSSGHFMYAENPNGLGGSYKEAILKIPHFHGDDVKCMSLAVFFYGTQSDMKLKLIGHVAPDMTRQLSEISSFSSTWAVANITIDGDVTGVDIVAVRGTRENIGVAIDDVTFIGGYCQDDVELSCTFDGGNTCLYTNDKDGPHDWNLASSAGSGYYMEFGSDAGVYPGDSARFSSPIMTRSIPRCVNFSYQICPQSSGTKLTLLTQVYFGGVALLRSPVWMSQSSNCTHWSPAQVDLDHQSHPFGVAFEASRGLSSGSIKVDDISITHGNCF
ncbi:uncharacterized protein [Argopecten irradians]|uniref:uncharacterized protein n=1 Tax=Argopecten irradians TaxID=31199 RepID=UPI00371DFF9D